MSNNKNKPNKDIKPGTRYNPADFYRNQLEIPVELKEELVAKGLVWRFIDLNRFRRNGFHRSGWMPYKRAADAKMLPGEEILGRDPEGFASRRGSLVLAVKPKEQRDAMRAHIRNQTEQQTRAIKKQPAEELRKLFRDAGLSEHAKVLDGYEEEGAE